MIEIEAADIVPLNRYTIEARYSGDWEPIERDEAQEAVTRAKKTFEKIRTRLI